MYILIEKKVITEKNIKTFEDGASPEKRKGATLEVHFLTMAL